MSGRTSGRVRFAAEGARAATLGALDRRPGGPTMRNRIFFGAVFLTVCIALFGLALILIDAWLKGNERLSWNLFTGFPSVLDPAAAGFRPAIVGTLYIIGFLVLIVVPLGVGAAVYLEEYAERERWWNRVIEVNIQNLAAVPAIIYGLLGVAFIARGPLGIGFSAFAGAITLALLVLPTVIIAAREAIRAVPSSIREGSLALGATQWQTIGRQVLPAAVPGITTGVILAVSRAMGEAAPLLLLGASTFMLTDPKPFGEPFMALPVLIYNYARRPQPELQELAAAGIIVMVVVLLALNAFAIWLRNRYEKKW